jgi:hypothetical protein
MLRKNKTWIIPALVLLFCRPGIAADPEFKAGGVALVLPAPASDASEVGDRVRTTLFELMVPSSNRLLSAYLPAQTLADLNAGKTMPGFDSYAMVEVIRGAEYNDSTSESFRQALQSVSEAFGHLDAQRSDWESELNVHLKSLGGRPIELGKPELLGILFQKTDATGFAMLSTMKQADDTKTMSVGFAYLRVRQRLIFAYLFRKYESPETVKSIKNELDAWTSEILAKNK